MPDEERGLPSNPYAERIVLATCWTSKHKGVVSEIVSKLTPDDFMVTSNRVVFAAIADLATKGVAVDIVTISNYLMSRGKLEQIGGISFLVDLDEGMPEISNYGSYIDILRGLTSRRRLIYLADEALKRAYLPAEDTSKIITSLTSNLRDVVQDGEKDGAESIAHFIDTYQGGFDRLMSPATHEPGILTEWPMINEATDGFHQDEIWVIGAPPRAGKTALALNLARHVAGNGVPIAIFSLEMSKRSLFYRLICTEASVAFMRFRRGQISVAEEKKLTEASSLVYNLPLYMDARSGLTPADYANRLETMVEKYGIRLSIIDYIQIMKSNNSRLTGAERMSSICLDLQDITKRTHIPVLLLSQLSRDSSKNKRKPEIADFKDSGAIEAIADVGALIYREELYSKDNSSLKGKTSLIFDKVRNGESTTIPMKYVGWRMAFEEYTGEEVSSNG